MGTQGQHAHGGDGAALARRSAGSTVAGFFAMRARLHPERIAIEEIGRDDLPTLSYGALDDRTRRLATALRDRGIGRGDRVAILSENRMEFLELFIAAARIGVIVACQNWRLATPELKHCVELVEPAFAFVSPRTRPPGRRSAATGRRRSSLAKPMKRCSRPMHRA